MSPTRRAVTVLVLLGGLIPIAIVAVDVAHHAQNVPFWDEWHDQMDIALKTVEGSLTVGDVLQQHNDGRVVFTNLLTALSARLAGWSLKLEMAVSLVLAGGTLLLLTSLYRASDPRGWIVAWIPFSALVFSMPQRRTWLWAIQGHYLFLVLFVVAGLLIVRRCEVGWRPLAVGAVLAGCATVSFANGVLAWAVMLPVLWMLGYRWSHLLGWTATAAAAAGFYLATLEIQAPQSLPADPLALPRFVVVYLGTAFTVREVVVHPPGELWLTAVLGAIGLLVLGVNVVLLWRAERSWRDLAPWVGMALFVAGSAVLAGLARHPLGIEAATASRYVTMATLFWVAFVAVGLMAMTRLGPARPWVWDGNLVVMVVLLAALVVGSWRFSGSRATITEAHRACFLAYPTSRDATCMRDLNPVLRAGHPERPAMLEKVDRLARHGMAAFGEPRRLTPP
jgi:hypothetical protein